MSNIRSVICTSFLLTAASITHAEEVPKPTAKTTEQAAAVAFTDLKAASAFQSFVKNWDEEKTPVLCAVIRNTADWDQIWGKAAVMGKNKPFSPDAAFYDKQQILLVARIVEDEDLLKPTAVTLGKDGVLTFSYTLAKPAKKNSFTMKWPLAVSIPRDTKFQSVVFMENGKVVGRLNAAKE